MVHFGPAWVCLEFSSELPVWAIFCLLAHVSGVFGPFFASKSQNQALHAHVRAENGPKTVETRPN
jgi:hypothetical protein